MGHRLDIRRVLGEGPFREIGRPARVTAVERHGCLLVAGRLGHVAWRGKGEWRPWRLGVYDSVTLRLRHLVPVRHPVTVLAPHPRLPLVAVGSGTYDGVWHFRGGLLLLDLVTGRVTDLLARTRKVVHLAWEDGRALRVTLSPEDQDGGLGTVFEKTVALDDWTRAPEGLIDPDDGTFRRIGRTAVPRPRDEDAARALARLTGGRRQWRRPVHDVAVLPDGRILAACGGPNELECWEETGVLRRAVPVTGDVPGRTTAAGAGRVLPAPDGASAWVTGVGYDLDERTGRYVPRDRTVRRIATADGGVRERLDFPVAMTAAATAEGRLLLRPRKRPARHPSVLLAPTGEETARLALGDIDGASGLRVRRSARAFYVGVRGPRGTARVRAVEPPRGRGKPAVRELFPVAWETGAPYRAGAHDAVEVPGALVLSGWTHESPPGPVRAPAEGTFVVSRRLPDGRVNWVHRTDGPLAGMDGDAERLHVVYVTGEVEVLDTRTGAALARHTLRVDGRPVPAACVTYRPGPRRLVVGTVDGRVLDCAVTG